MGCPTNAQIRKGASEYYDDNVDRYEEAKAEAFKEYFVDEVDGLEVSEIDVDWFQGLLDTFTYPDTSEWLESEYESYIGDIEDQCYEAYKEERMERGQR